MNPDDNEIISNAKVENISIQLYRGAFLTCWVHLNYGTTCQGFGGYVLGKPNESNPTTFTSDYLCLLLQCLGVENLNDGVGKDVRVIKSDDSWSANISGIGHITKDIWLKPEELGAL